MRKAITIGIMACSFFAVKAQDTIYMKNGEKINAKVTEVGVNEIKYKKTQNPDGPVYTTTKNDIALIEYKNGYKEVYSADNSSTASGDNNKTGNNANANRGRGNNYYFGGGGFNRPNVIIVPRIGPMIGAYRWHRHGWRRWCW